MRFDRLRLTGFKSFVDPTELVIRDGLTGIVGPNGCGKSNLLEALRWVMGENRPTAMRGDGMEDVIFAGTTRRPARAQAEVTLTIDNAERRAPPGMNDADQLDITRRITREAGSAFRVNGREVRARDVQMLFADASTGAHSPALVRQGQISELINARPRARRRILEEAAGISGLYQRRHEAELRLNAAEANLARVDDLVEQLAAQAAQLARQSRAAARYREIGAALRRAEGLLLHHRWAEAAATAAEAAEALAAARRAEAAAEARARAAETARAAAEAALPPLREEEQVAAAILSRATVEREALDVAEARAAEAIAALRARLAQLDGDAQREAALNRDAGEVLARLSAERAGLDRARDGHAGREAALAAEAAEAAAALETIESRLAELTAEAARAAARYQSAARLVQDLEQTERCATTAAAAAEAGLAAATEAGAAAEAARVTAEQALGAARLAAEQAEAGLAAAEAARAGLEADLAAARAARAEAEGDLAALRSEVAALGRLVDRGAREGRAVLDLVRVAPGAELALGAALGDELELGLAADGQGTGGQGTGWHTLAPLPGDPTLPPGAEPLAARVEAPPALARRLALTGVMADAAQAATAQPALLPGQALVTPAGDLLRWDGVRIMAGEAGSAAALHLQKVNRLAALTREAADAEARAATARATHEDRRAAEAAAAAAERAARDARREAERALAEAGRALARAESDLALAQGRARSAAAELARHRADAAEAGARLAEARRALEALPDPAAAAAAVGHARTAVEAARIATMSRRAALDDLRREEAGRARRLQSIARDEAGWRQRLAEAAGRGAELAARRDEAAAELAAAEAQPARLATRRATLAEAEAGARARLDRARAALAAAEAALREAAAGEREAARAASDLREARAAAEARAEAATAAEAAARARIEDETGLAPDALGAPLGAPGDPAASPGPEHRPETLEATILRLRQQREALGAVNLRADEDRRELEAERARIEAERTELAEAIRKLRQGIGALNREGRERLLAAFDTVNASFAALFTHLFGGGEARLVLVESDDPLEAGLEIMCQPPGKKLATLSLLSGGEQTLTALALIFAVFLSSPAPICVLDEVDAPLDDANVTRFCDLMDEMTRRTRTRFLVITHHAVTMARMDRLFGVTMVEQGVSQLVSVDLKRAEALVA